MILLKVHSVKAKEKGKEHILRKCTLNLAGIPIDVYIKEVAVSMTKNRLIKKI
jgi:hypothetical protein